MTVPRILALQFLSFWHQSGSSRFTNNVLLKLVVLGSLAQTKIQATHSVNAAGWNTAPQGIEHVANRSFSTCCPFLAKSSCTRWIIGLIKISYKGSATVVFCTLHTVLNACIQLFKRKQTTKKCLYSLFTRFGSTLNP